MNSRQALQARSVYEAVQTLEPLPPTPECAELRRMRDALARHSDAIADLAQRQYNATQERSFPKTVNAVERRAIRTKHLIPVARRARRLFKHEPAVLRALRVPPAHDTLEAHADAALAMAKALRPHAKFCHAEGFRPGFITDLKAAGTALRARTMLTSAAKRELSLVTRKLDDAIRQARELASLLDAELSSVALAKAEADRRSNLLGARGRSRTFDALVFQWRRAYKLGKTIGRPKQKRGRPGQARPAE